MADRTPSLLGNSDSLTPPQHDALLALNLRQMQAADAPPELGTWTSEVAEVLGWSNQTTGRVLAACERKGYVQGFTDWDDWHSRPRVVTGWELTAQGVVVLEANRHLVPA